MTNSRQKGKRGELELAKVLREYGYTARRGQQYSGANGDADVVGIPGVHIECKRFKHPLTAGQLKKAMQQSERDALDGELPIVVHRADRKPWQVYDGKQNITLDAFVKARKETK